MAQNLNQQYFVLVVDLLALAGQTHELVLLLLNQGVFGLSYLSLARFGLTFMLSDFW